MMYIFAVDACAAKGNGRWPAGERHPVLVVVSADHPENAEQVSRDGLRVYGWERINIRRFKQVSENETGLTDEVLLAAHRRARDSGYAMVVYKEPMVD